MFEPAEVAGHDSFGGLHFDADNAPICSFEHSVDLDTVSSAKVVKGHPLTRPTRLPREITQDEVLEQRPHRGVVFRQPALPHGRPFETL